MDGPQAWERRSPDRPGILFHEQSSEIDIGKVSRLGTFGLGSVLSGNVAGDRDNAQKPKPEKSRECPTSTTHAGRTVLRMCTINPRTTREDIRETIEVLTTAAIEPRGGG